MVFEASSILSKVTATFLNGHLGRPINVLTAWRYALSPCLSTFLRYCEDYPRLFTCPQAVSLQIQES